LNKYEFKTDEQAEAFCDKIAECMVSFFSISLDEAIARVNQQWKGQAIVGLDIVYHKDPENWAKDIYWTADSYWELSGEARERLRLPPVKPKPLPE
jgi:hypothetical protein